MIAEVVYILCALTALVCAVLLGRGYRRSRQRLLLWSAICFFGLFIANALTFVDFVVVPGVDLHWLRSSVGLAAEGLLVFGLIWEAP